MHIQLSRNLASFVSASAFLLVLLLTPSQASSQIERWLDRAPAIAGLLLDLVDEIETFIDSDEIIIKFISDDLSEDEVTFLDSYFKSN